MGVFEGHESSFVATAVGGDHPEAEGFLGSANCPPELRRFLVAAAFGKNARESCEAVGDVTLAMGASADPIEDVEILVVELGSLGELPLVEREITTLQPQTREAAVVANVGVHLFRLKEDALRFLETFEIAQHGSEMGESIGFLGAAALRSHLRESLLYQRHRELEIAAVPCNACSHPLDPPDGLFRFRQLVRECECLRPVLFSEGCVGKDPEGDDAGRAMCVEPHAGTARARC